MQTINLFVGYFNNTNFNNLFHNYSKTSGENIQNGKWVERKSFITIDNIIMESKRAEARSVQLALDRQKLDLYKQRLNAHKNTSQSFANKMKERGGD